jgi:D-arabinose 5-phosphate isomerase GutQ
LDDLNELDKRIEATIKSITKARQEQIAAEAKEVLQLDQAADSANAKVEVTHETTVEISKAA